MYYLLDGSSYIYRAYHGLPPLHDAEGNTTHAVFGFLKMIFRLIAEQPDGIVIAWDSPVQTIRSQQYSKYKATRTKMPDDLRQQMKIIHTIVETLGIPHLTAPGYEADDIIATLAYQHPLANWRIYTGDKDLKQLITDQVTIMDPMKNILWTQELFMQKFGFGPKCMVDYLSLIGDVSDNLPGIAGIGPKTAVELICQYQSLDGIYHNILSCSPSLQEKLVSGREIVYRTQSLIQLCDIPELSTSLSDFHISIDRGQRTSLLIDTRGFASLNKNIQELKRSLHHGAQGGLF